MEENLILVMRQLTVRCLPKDLPDNIEIDITALKIGQSVRIESLDTENIEFLHPNSLVVVSIKTAKSSSNRRRTLKVKLLKVKLLKVKLLKVGKKKILIHKLQ